MSANIPVLIIYDENGNQVEIPAIKGDAYKLTAADKQEIAEIVKNMLENGDEVRY